MYTPRTLFKNICSGWNNSVIQNLTSDSTSLCIEKVLIYSKLSRYEYEKKKHKMFNDKELETYIRNRGSDFEKLVHYHDLHKKFEASIAETMKCMGFDVEIVNRADCRDHHIQNSDIIVPVGGDGTFLSAAGHVYNNKKPLMGFNSDPNRSEGYLCLPKRYSSNIKEALKKLQKGDFAWLMRSRIRTTLIVSENKNLVPNFLHDIIQNVDLPVKLTAANASNERTRILPYLALNEVFMGESLSARVSHLQMRLDGSSTTTNIKSSGLCVCTGTGSTSWHLSMNRLPVQSVADLLRLLDIEATEGKDSLATVLAEIYNKNLIFTPDDKRMGYTIRDLISAGVWPQPKGIKSRGFAEKIEIKSYCFDACLVVDGGVSFSFNDGTIALLEILPEDSLRTVVLKD